MEIEVKYKIPIELENEIIRFMKCPDVFEFKIGGNKYIIERIFELCCFNLHVNDDAKYYNLSTPDEIISIINGYLNK